MTWLSLPVEEGLYVYRLFSILDIWLKITFLTLLKSMLNLWYQILCHSIIELLMYSGGMALNIAVGANGHWKRRV